jgi:hypothetical protein
VLLVAERALTSQAAPATLPASPAPNALVRLASKRSVREGSRSSSSRLVGRSRRLAGSRRRGSGAGGLAQVQDLHFPSDRLVCGRESGI